MECKACSSPDFTTVARVGNLKLVVCTACDRRCRPDAVPATPDIVPVSVIFDDEPATVYPQNIGIGDPDTFSHDDEETIFYYVENMAELETLRDINNGNGWHVVEVDLGN
jgi:hypothetical protein